ncbi:MAG: alpha/beta hydrolase [Lachnospiraceae bacterium]|nr:alpha/beta hydrolase [Lachnospiraceae bacterium]
MKKVLKRIFKFIGVALLSFVVLIMLFLFGVKIWNHIAMKSEEELLANHPGTCVEVDGHNMNLYIEGEGEHTLVFMSGWKCTSPIYSFKPLYSKLSGNYRCVVIEKFGYGFSDEFDGLRDFDTILRQDREALQKAGIEGPYVLCAHSLSGLEAELWAQKYPEEVEAIIGLDMCVGGCFDPVEDTKDCATQNKIDKFGAFFGMNRFLMSISEFEGYTDEEIKSYIAVGCKNLGNDTAQREMEGIVAVFDEINCMPLPNVPTIQYVSGVNKNDEMWVGSHQNIVNASTDGNYVQLECGHNVYEYESERIAKDMKEFINTL